MWYLLSIIRSHNGHLWFSNCLSDTEQMLKTFSLGHGTQLSLAPNLLSLFSCGHEGSAMIIVGCGSIVVFMTVSQDGGGSMSQGGGVAGRLWRLVSIGGGFWAERRSSAEALRILSSLLHMIKSYKQSSTVRSCPIRLRAKEPANLKEPMNIMC